MRGEQKRNYRDALSIVKENEKVYTGLKSIEGRYRRAVLLRYMVSSVCVLSMIAYIVGMLCYRVYRGDTSTPAVLGGVALLIQGTLVGCLVYYILKRDFVRLDEDILSWVNGFLRDRYTCVSDDSVELVFKKGKCYISYKEFGLMREQVGVYEEGKCRLEVREFYIVKPDCKLEKSREYVVVSM